MLCLLSFIYDVFTDLFALRFRLFLWFGFNDVSGWLLLQGVYVCLVDCVLDL